MKKLAITIFSVSLLLISCKTSQLGTNNDDIYSDPSEEKRIYLAKQEELKKQKAEREAKLNAESAAQKAKDEANPYYKDPEYSTDDYYDYAYASRVRRFNNPVYGAGYYDNYYTNSYWYNNNPNCYGSSIYGSYNFWNTNNSIYVGNSYNNGYCNNSYYNGYGYNNGYYSGNNGYCNGYNNGYNSYGYNPYGYNYNYNPYYSNYGYGYNQPWNCYNNYGNNAWGYNNGYNGNNNNWGYFNGHDNNSNYYYGPRTGNSGSNSTRSSHGGMIVPKDLDGERAQFVNSVIQAQDNTPKFDENVKRHQIKQTSIGIPDIGSGGTYSNPNTNAPVKIDDTKYYPTNTSPNHNNNNTNTGGGWNGGNSGTNSNSNNGNTWNSGNTGTNTNPNSGNTGNTNTQPSTWGNSTNVDSNPVKSPVRNGSGGKITETNSASQDNNSGNFNRNSGGGNSGGGNSTPTKSGSSNKPR